MDMRTKHQLAADLNRTIVDIQLAASELFKDETRLKTVIQRLQAAEDGLGAVLRTIDDVEPNEGIPETQEAPPAVADNPVPDP